jgi:hypothetical protein
MTLIKFVICCAITLGVATVCSAKDWRGIVPLKSTRADVEKLVGVPKQRSEVGSYYRFHDEIAVVWFQSQPCDQCSWDWHVPVGTVTTIGVIPLSAHAPKPSDVDGFKSKDNNGGFVYYTNEVDGLTIETHKGKVTSLQDGPEKRFENLRCVPKDCIADPSGSFDEYSLLRWEDEKARLDNFGIRLKEEMGRGVIVISGPNEVQRAKLLKHAVRARRHLETLGLEPQRILIADGGYRETSLFALSFYSIGSFKYRIYLWLQPDPQKPSTRAMTKTKLSSQ